MQAEVKSSRQRPTLSLVPAQKHGESVLHKLPRSRKQRHDTGEAAQRCAHHARVLMSELKTVWRQAGSDPPKVPMREGRLRLTKNLFGQIGGDRHPETFSLIGFDHQEYPENESEQIKQSVESPAE